MGFFSLTYTRAGPYAPGVGGLGGFPRVFLSGGGGGGAAAGAPPAPTLTGFTPTSGPVGSSATLNGTNFTGATAVTFNGVSASFTVSSDTAIQATVPAGATPGPLSGTHPRGTATSATPVP